MLVVNLASIVIGVVAWSMPRIKMPPWTIGRSRTPTPVGRILNDTLLGPRKQIVASLYIVAGILGIILQLHENVIITVGGVSLLVGKLVAVPDPTKNKKPQPRPTAASVYARTTDDLIYGFLTRPENAAFKDQVFADTDKCIVAQILIRKMLAYAPTNQLYAQMQYGREFHDDLLTALARIKREERDRPASPSPKDPPPASVFDVVLTEIGPSYIRTIAAIIRITPLRLKNARELVGRGVPATILTCVSQDYAELAQDVLQDAGATVELRAAEIPD